MPIKTCKICRKRFVVKYERCSRAHCSKKCRSITQSVTRTGTHPTKKTIQKFKDRMRSCTGEKAIRWKGGKTKHPCGYILVRQPNHPFTAKNKYVLEHRLVMEKHLGRYLTPKEVVHHINHNPSDNRIENLILYKGQSEHRTGHAKPKF